MNFQQTRHGAVCIVSGKDGYPREEATEILLNVQEIAFTFHLIAQKTKEEQAAATDPPSAEPDKMAGWCPDI